jgi:hypothetical protein
MCGVHSSIKLGRWHTAMGKDGQPAAKGQGKVVTDARFAAVHHDPRFQRFPRAKAKVEIDERFAGKWRQWGRCLGARAGSEP